LATDLRYGLVPLFATIPDIKNRQRVLVPPFSSMNLDTFDAIKAKLHRQGISDRLNSMPYRLWNCEGHGAPENSKGGG
jgi:hypothetical protein